MTRPASMRLLTRDECLSVARAGLDATAEALTYPCRVCGARLDDLTDPLCNMPGGLPIMTVQTESPRPVSLHFDDCDWSFDALQFNDGTLAVTEATYVKLQKDGHIDGGFLGPEFGPASDYAPPIPDSLLRNISGWEVNYDADSGYAIFIERTGVTPSLLGPYATIDDAESEVADLRTNGQEGRVEILPLQPGWAAPTASLHVRCSVCLRLVPTTIRGAVVDGSGRCTQCQP